MNKRPFTVNLVTENGQYPLTVPIQDETKAGLAYSLLYIMTEGGEASFILGEDEFSPHGDQIKVFDADGNEFDPPIDWEWFPGPGPTEPSAEKYSIHCQAPIDFAPLTKDLEKAKDMMNFMHFGMNESVAICMPDDDGIYQEINAKQVYVSDEIGNCLGDVEFENPNWANERSDLTLKEEDLADLTANETLEQ